MATSLNNAAPPVTPTVTPHAPHHAPDAPGGAYLSDEEILGIFDESMSSPANARGNSSESGGDSFWDASSQESDAHSSFGRVRTPAVAANARVAQGGVKPWGHSQPNSGAPPNTPRSSTNRTEINADPLSTDPSSSVNEKPDVFDSTSATESAPAPLPEWLAEVSAAAPNAAPELVNLWQRANALDTFDRAFYGADASAQQQLITQLYSDDPAAFRAMVSAAAQLLDGSARNGSSRDGSLGSSPAIRAAQFQNESVAQVAAVPPGGTGRTEAFPRHTAPPHRGNDSPVGAHHPQVPGTQSDTGDSSYSPPSRTNNSADAAQSAAAENFNPAAYAQFEQSTNDAVVTDVSRAIDRALDRALPDGIADGARRRIATDTLAEVHTALRGDRQLASQVAGMLSGSFNAGSSDPRAANVPGSITPRFDNATRDAIARVIATRARGVVPEAARRVIGEWTGSVLSAHRERTSRQQSASARVDVVGSQASTPVARRAVKSSDINYRATSDEDILSW